MNNVNDASSQAPNEPDVKSGSQSQKIDWERIAIIISSIALLISIVTGFIAYRLDKVSNSLNEISNQLTETIRREALDTRNIATYQRYEDLFWSDDSVNEARAVAFFRRDGNLGYKCYYLYGEFIEAQNSLEPERRMRLRKHLAHIFEAKEFDDIVKVKCK